MEAPRPQVLALVRDCTESRRRDDAGRRDDDLRDDRAACAAHETLETAAGWSRSSVRAARLDSLGAGAQVLRRVAPSLSETFAAVVGIAIGPQSGVCGTAAHRKRPVIVADVASDPACADWRALIDAEGIASCWSYPMIDKADEVLGTLAVYCREPREPGAAEVAVIERVRDLATIAVDLLRAEQALRFTQFAVDHVADLIFQVDADARIIEVNTAACRRLGYSRTELLAMRLFDIDPDYPESSWPETWADLRRRKHLRLESRHRTKTGEVYPVDVAANYVEHEGRSFSYGIVRDVTDWRASVAALASEERLRLATEAGPWGPGSGGRDEPPALLAQSSESLRHQRRGRDGRSEAFYAVIHDDDCASSPSSARPTARRRSRISSFGSCDPTGRRWLEPQPVALRCAGAALRMVGIVTDVGQRKHDERERESLLAELQAAT